MQNRLPGNLSHKAVGTKPAYDIKTTTHEIIFFPNPAIAIRNHIYCTKTASQESYLQYYQHINQAKYKSFKGDYQHADSLFSRAFQLVKKPFFADCLLAAKNGLNISPETTFRYLDRGIDVGLTLERVREFKR